MAASQIAQFLSRPVAMFKYSQILTNYLYNSHYTSLLACFSSLGSSSVDVRVYPEGLTAFSLSAMYFRYRLAGDCISGKFTADTENKMTQAFKQTNKLEAFACFLGSIPQDYLEYPLIKLHFFHANEDIGGALAYAEQNDFLVIMNFDDTKQNAKYDDLAREHKVTIIILRPGELYKGEQNDFAEFACIYYNYQKTPNPLISGMLLQLQNTVATYAARTLADIVQKATFTASTYANLKNMLFTKKPDGFAQFSRDYINLYSGDLLSMCYYHQAALSFYENAQRGHDHNVSLLAGERICRVHLIFALYSKQLEVFNYYSIWMLYTLMNESSSLVLKRRIVVFLFLAVRDCDLYNESAGKMLVLTGGLQGAHCNLHAYNYYVKFGIKQLDYLLASARLYAKGGEWALSSALTYDLLRKIVRLKPYEPGKQAALALYSESFQALGLLEKAQQTCIYLAGIGQRRSWQLDLPDSIRCHIYYVLQDGCVALNESLVAINGLGYDLRDYTAVPGGCIHLDDMQTLITTEPRNAYYAARATEILCSGGTVPEIDVFEPLFAYRCGDAYFGTDLREFGMDDYLASNRLCATPADLAINSGLFCKEAPTYKIDPCVGDTVKLIINVENRMYYVVFALDRAELVSEQQKIAINGEFRAKCGGKFAFVFEFTVQHDVHFTRLVIGFKHVQVAIGLDIAVKCTAREQVPRIELKMQPKAGQICNGTIMCENGLISCNAPYCIFFCNAEDALSSTAVENEFSRQVWSIFSEKNTKVQELLAERRVARCELTRQILRKLQYRLLVGSRKTAYMNFKRCSERTTFYCMFVQPGTYCVKFYAFAGGRLRMLARTFQVADMPLPKPQLVYHGPRAFAYRAHVYCRGDVEMHLLLARETVKCENGEGIIRLTADKCAEHSLLRNVFIYYEGLFYEYARASLALIVDERLRDMYAKQFVESSELKEQRKTLAYFIEQDKRMLSEMHNLYFHNCITTQPYVLCARTYQFHAFYFKTLKVIAHNGLVFDAAYNDYSIYVYVLNLRPYEVKIMISVSESSKCLVSGCRSFEALIAPGSTLKQTIHVCGDPTGSHVLFYYDETKSFTQILK